MVGFGIGVFTRDVCDVVTRCADDMAGGWLRGRRHTPRYVYRGLRAYLPSLVFGSPLFTVIIDLSPTVKGRREGLF